jgi:hypothetical protein
MRLMKNTIVLTVLVSLVCGATGAASRPDAIVITERQDTYELTVPVSRLILNIPKEGFKQMVVSRADATASWRYFSFEDTVQHLYVSGWFEAQSEFPGTAAYWEMSKAAWSRAHVPTPESVEFKKLGGWDAIVYQMPRSSGSNSNLQIHWTEAGTWINLHLSVDSEAPATENRLRLESLVARLRVSTK